jgi:hypothetical protein
MREEKNRTNGTDRTNETYEPPLIPAHGGYRKLKSYQAAEIATPDAQRRCGDATVAFCDRFIDRRSQVRSVPVRAYRVTPHGVTTSQASATSKKTEIKLTGVARASLEELLQDYQDCLRQHRLPT